MAISFIHLASQSSQMLAWHRIMWSNFGRNPSKPVEIVRQSEGTLVLPSHNPELHITLSPFNTDSGRKYFKEYETY